MIPSFAVLFQPGGAESPSLCTFPGVKLPTEALMDTH